jgi:hypothetical protein
MQCFQCDTRSTITSWPAVFGLLRLPASAVVAAPSFISLSFIPLARSLPENLKGKYLQSLRGHVAS